jgi:hypothetical protein
VIELAAENRDEFFVVAGLDDAVVKIEIAFLLKILAPRAALYSLFVLIQESPDRRDLFVAHVLRSQSCRHTFESFAYEVQFHDLFERESYDARSRVRNMLHEASAFQTANSFSKWTAADFVLVCEIRFADLLPRRYRARHYRFGQVIR